MRHFCKRYLDKMNKTISTVLAVSILLGVPAVSADFYFATPEENKNQAESELEGVNSEVENIKGEKEDIQVELSETAELLSELLADKALLEKDIEKTQQAIDETAIALEEAEQREANGYDAMVLRIQYMYENSVGNSFWEAIIGSKGLTDLLNRIAYISQVYKTDRQLMKEYAATVEEVKELAESLDIEMNNLLTLQENLEHQQAELEVVMEELKADMNSYDEQLAAAEAKAVELAAYIEEQNRLIQEEEERRRQEEEERKRQEEEERKRQEEEERKRQEEEERKRQEEEERKRQESEEEERRRQESEEAARRESEEAEKNSEGFTGTENSGFEPETSEPETSEPESDGAENDSDTLTGEDIVAYALQFVGNPYKWGGNSLTNGCDCSGFVNLIYKHFGFKSVPRQSQSFKKYGVAVDYADIQPGDIVVYPGHVAIYIGNGKIVEAQSTRAGITCNRSVTSGTITAIRRVIGYEERNE